jgi:hypothetical protein
MTISDNRSQLNWKSSAFYVVLFSFLWLFELDLLIEAFPHPPAIRVIISATCLLIGPIVVRKNFLIALAGWKARNRPA